MTTADRTPTPQALSLADRLGAVALVADVAQVLSPTPTLRRIVLRSDAVSTWQVAPGQDVMVTVGHVRRRYTIRTFDPSAGMLAIHAVVHEGGPGGRWAGSVAVGDTVELIGPRGKVRVAPYSDWHLVVGDETFVPAAFTILEALSTDTPALAVLEVGAAIDERPLQATVMMPGGPTWVHRTEEERADRRRHDGLLRALRGLDLPAGVGHAYLGGEAHLVREVRALLAERGVPLDRIQPKAYWRADAPNAAHGEPDAVDR